MLSKNQIKLINSLKLKKYRKIRRLFLAEGVKLVNELLASHIKVKTIFATFQWISNNMHLSNKFKDIIYKIDEDELKRISSLTSPNQILAIFEMPQYEIDYKFISSHLSLALDNIKDPGNLGTIIRIADWFGIENIFCSPETVDLYNPKVIQATMGSISRVKVHYIDLVDLILKLKIYIEKRIDRTSSDSHQEAVSNNCPDTAKQTVPQWRDKPFESFPIYGAFLDGDNIYKKPLTQNGLVILGNESDGISEKIKNYITDKLYIPTYPILGKMQTKPESLNVAVTTGIVCSEFRRWQNQ